MRIVKVDAEITKNRYVGHKCDRIQYLTMEKENMGYVKSKTSSRIPLPIEPLPPIPVSLRRKSFDHGTEIKKRSPLKTLNHQAAGSSDQKSLRKKKGTPLRVDARHVTLRQDSYENDLDWNFEVFHNQVQNNANNDVTNKSGKEEDLIRFSSGGKSRKSLSLAKAVTPADVSPSVEHNRIKNIKKSLKRPHSKELQGLSPGKAPKAGEVPHLHLSHKERIFDRLKSPDYLKKIYMHCLNRDYSVDLLRYLIVKEKKTSRILFVKEKNRACLVNWLMRVNGPDGNPAVIQTACWYLDTILSKEVVSTGKMQLVAATCYWIAQKLHGAYMSATKLAQFSNMAFEPMDLVAAERIILRKLRFPTHPVVAQDFLPYFAWQCDCKHPGEIEVAASFICLSGLMVHLRLAGEYPSVVAAAAVKNALMLLKRTELMPKLLFCPIYREAESKGGDFQATCLAQRNAIRTVACSEYEYRAPYEHYGAPPFYLAKKIVKAACSFAVNDARQKSIDV